jgi:3-oxoacyl-[acyl-carrier-protein] synthase II
MGKRVVITGLGAITPIGNSPVELWSNILKEKVGIDHIKSFDTSNLKVKLAANVSDFDPSQYMDLREIRHMDMFCQYAIASTSQAISSSGLDLEQEDLTKIATCIGTGVGGMPVLEHENKKLIENGPGAIQVWALPKFMVNSAAGQVAIKFGLKGNCIDITTACATGTNSIGEAYRMLQANDLNVVIAGGTESCITPLTVACFQSITALSCVNNPKEASLPFDKNRSGFVLGEGAGCIVLETLEHAQARDAKILAEIVGYGATCDASHITSPNGDGIERAMKLALAEANIDCKDIDVINAHGTATYLNDLIETKAMKNVFGNAIYDINVQSTKSMVGHMIGAAGAVEIVVCVMEILNMYVHPTVGLKVCDDGMDLNYTKKAVVNKNINYIMSNSLAFGGHNASIILKKYED